MSKVKVMVVEDELVIAMNICDLLEELGYEVTEPITNYDDAKTCLKEEKPDIVLLDIQIAGDKTGIDIANHIRSNYDIPFIYLTSNSDKRTLDEAKLTQPSSYLVKPFNQDDLYTSLEVALYNYRDQKSPQAKTDDIFINDAIFVKNKNMFHKVRFTDIVYLKSEHVYIELYTVNNKKHLIRGSISNFIERLPKQFFRTHRSYAVNLDYLDAINSIHVVINNIEIPIGKMFRNDLMKIIRVE